MQILFCCYCGVFQLKMAKKTHSSFSQCNVIADFCFFGVCVLFSRFALSVRCQECWHLFFVRLWLSYLMALEIEMSWCINLILTKDIEPKNKITFRLKSNWQRSYEPSKFKIELISLKHYFITLLLTRNDLFRWQ